ncbi:phosphotransferase enzyme family protein [delta proteobacterium NaphS2]|nr:phosphotransferase enzyme family protein [delta proteobacterium NaphS2]
MKGKASGDCGFSVDPLPGDGSHRIFRRIHASGGTSFIAMANPPVSADRKRENNAYVMIGRHLQRKGIPIPVIHQYDLDEGWFIMEDLGSVNLQQRVLSGNDAVFLYERILDHLFRLQTLGSEGFNPAWCAQTERYDHTVMLKYESHYFRDAFVRGFLAYEGSLNGLETVFGHLAEKASRADGRFFMHRDFQSRNIMVDDEKIGFIDWQGGRAGPLGYDLASLLLDPYVRLPRHLQQEIYETYLEILKNHHPDLVAPFERDYPYLAIQRNLQILGAFSFLSKVMKKTQFAAYIPHALKTLGNLARKTSDAGLKPLGEFLLRIDLPDNLSA